jgi:hypothetical protein
MAISNLPYDDRAIIDALKSVSVLNETVSNVSVNFLDNEISENSTATVTATLSWVVSSAAAVRILDGAKPEPSAQAPGLAAQG